MEAEGSEEAGDEGTADIVTVLAGSLECVEDGEPLPLDDVEGAEARNVRSRLCIIGDVDEAAKTTFCK